MADTNNTTALSPGHPLSGDRAHTISPVPASETRDTEGARSNRTSVAPASPHSVNNIDTQSSQHLNPSSNQSNPALYLPSSARLSAVNRKLKTEFSSFPKCFKAMHLNAQSIQPHLHELRGIVDGVSLHAILVSESWLKPALSTNVVNIPGYRLCRIHYSEKRH
ncbi:hypothetical protein M8J75_007042 [Diaphorina citri]|nr:hypothetical protein M8J75_007042 [Diaphorina citri]